jgi:hypothetical protein
MKLPPQKQSLSRRELLSALLKRSVEAVGSLGSEGGYVLSDLPNMPDEELASMRPMVNPDFEIFVDQGTVCGRSRVTGDTFKLLTMEKANLAAFNLFNGMHRLDEVGERLSREMGWDRAEGFAFARKIFVSLALRQVCIPKDPPAFTE